LLLYAITDRSQLKTPLLARIALLLQAGVDFVQIREKDLTARELLALATAAVALPNPHAARILINDRADVALAAGAHGVHLPAQAISASSVRAVAPPGFTIAVSCHSLEEIARVESEGADLAVLGPIFDTASKHGYGPPLGPSVLGEAASKRRLPVLALGGVTLNNFHQCRDAAGIAGISLFQNASDPAALVRTLRSGR
jgi:thiamine-phosphate pyrophosphorylase